MSIMDGIGKKTRDMADVSRYNTMITDEEKRQEDAYLRLGKLYYERHASDFEDCFETEVRILDESIAKVKEYNRQILLIKEAVVCPRCGAESPVGSAFCISCGSPIPKEASPLGNDKTQCPSCGKILDAGMNFCTYCGSPLNKKEKSEDKVEENTEMADVEDEPDTIIIEPDKPDDSRKCASCGAKLEAGEHFCTICGTKVDV